MSPLYLYAGVGAVAVALFLVLVVLVRRVQKRGLTRRSLNLALFSVTLPEPEEEEQKVSARDRLERDIAPMEQFLSSFNNRKIGFWKSILYGQPYVALEMAVKKEGTEIINYVAVPRSLTSVFEKQVHSYFPYAEVKKSEDYSIFEPKGLNSGAYLMTTRSPIVPLMTYRTLEVDPMSAVVTAMTKIAEYNEGVALQIILKPTKFKKQRKLASKVLKELNEGHDFSTAMQRAQTAKSREFRELVMPTPVDDKSKMKPMTGKPFEESIIKAIQGKLTKHHFQANMRLVVSADSKERSEQLLMELENSFSQLSNPEGNILKTKHIKGNKIKRFVFNYIFRLPIK